MKISVSEELRNACPDFVGCALFAPINNTETNADLWAEIGEMTRWLRDNFTIDTVKQRSGIKATRQGYKRCGKEPNRYRPSNEQLCRRLLQDKDLYAVSTVVDLINLASIRFAYSIGGFDADKIVGDSLTLGVGQAGEKFEGIGRGLLNIEGLPVYRDAVGGIGTPTSDEERTKMGLSTTAIHVNINAFAPEMPLEEMMEWTISLLRKYASATQITQYIVKP